ncbi:type IV pilin protein [Timonella senegalensis]|uniref:type IV pilin protein n=1 Tax=Timonella senegalensis TaxID=1465825 RepID=UPI0028AD63EE|nr:prepilin-type N-terminal cleavage/methylation domain-containing protein [Timonella senegalensis]
MIARISKSLNEKEKGFTLIELLVVVIIIGILSAIAIPVFMNQRQKAVDAGIKSDLRSIANEVESYYVDNQAYPGSTEVAKGTDNKVKVGSAEGAASIKISDPNTEFTYESEGESYVLTGKNEDKGSGKTFTYSSAEGGLQTEAETE